MQVAQLKASRDKLLAELEKQFLEVDRLGVENSALSQACSIYSQLPYASKWACRIRIHIQGLHAMVPGVRPLGKNIALH